MCQLFLFHKDRIFSRLYRIFCQQFIFRWQPIESVIFAQHLAAPRREKEHGVWQALQEENDNAAKSTNLHRRPKGAGSVSEPASGHTHRDAATPTYLSANYTTRRHHYRD